MGGLSLRLGAQIGGWARRPCCRSFCGETWLEPISPLSGSDPGYDVR